MSNEKTYHDLITDLIAKAEEASGAELNSFTFLPRIVDGRLTRIKIDMRYEPMMKETEE